MTEIKRRVELEDDTTDDKVKTAEMFRLERQLGIPIRELLSYERQTREEVADALGINLSTVSLWRLRLRMGR